MAEKPFDDFGVVRFDVPIWNIMPVSSRPLIIIENRNEEKRTVSFSAWNYETQSFAWRDVVLSEKWWVTLHGAETDAVVVKIFESTDNPDKTSFQRLDILTGKVFGAVDVKYGTTQHDGLYPAQYLDGEPDFELVRDFLLKKLHVHALLGAEYLEAGEFIFISYYKGAPASFVNNFCVFNADGTCLLDEEIGTNLKGIGLNTFFILSDRVFFVKNKMELVTFRIV